MISATRSCSNFFFSFVECILTRSQDYGAGDYIVLAKKYHTLILTDVPRLQYHHRNPARRLILFLDAVYENKVGLMAYFFDSMS